MHSLAFTVFARPSDERLFDLEITLKAGDKDVVMGDTKEGSMAVRVAETMRLIHGKNKPGESSVQITSDIGGCEAVPRRNAPV